MQTQRFSWKSRARSFHVAFEGLYHFFCTQHNALIHLVATIVVIAAGFMAKLSITESIFITISVALVWIAELFNTAIEKLCDLYSPDHNTSIKFIKDIAAAAVLVTAIMAIMIGAFIFIPKIL